MFNWKPNAPEALPGPPSHPSPDQVLAAQLHHETNRTAARYLLPEGDRMQAAAISQLAFFLDVNDSLARGEAEAFFTQRAHARDRGALLGWMFSVAEKHVVARNGIFGCLTRSREHFRDVIEPALAQRSPPCGIEAWVAALKSRGQWSGV